MPGSVQCRGYETRKTELEQTQAQLEQMLGYVNAHYSEMTVEPLFTLSGPVEDPEPYQQQVSAMMSAMEDYIESTNGLPDPTELQRQQTQIVRPQKAVGLIPGLGILKNADEVVTLLKNALPQLMPYADEMATVLRQAFQNGSLGLGALAGGTRYVDDLADAGQTARRADDLAEGVGELSDATRAAQRLTETREAVADGAGVVDDVGLVDEVIDSGQGLGYNGHHQLGNIDLMPANLMEELANSGVKYTEEDVLMVTKNADGDLMWLEVGTDQRGLTHIWKHHGNDFENRGFTRTDLPSFAAVLVSQKPIDGTVLLTSRGYEAVYMYEGKYYRMAYGTNGFITSMYPLRESKIFRNK